MKNKQWKLSAIFLLGFGLAAMQAQNAQEFTDLKGDYLGQPLPGETPEVFARGIVSDSFQQHGVPTFSPDGNEVFWQTNRLDNDKKWLHFYKTMRRIGGRWTAPETTSYGPAPVFSPDGKRLYFCDKEDLSFIEKRGNSWNEPKSVGLVTRFPEMRFVYFPSIARNGTLYFMGFHQGSRLNIAIYRAELINGEYAKPELLPPTINTPGDSVLNWTPYVAPDESYLIFCSRRITPKDDYGDLYICFRQPDGSWADRMSLGEPINTRGLERFPAVSPDGKYLFFTRDTPDYDEDVYWVSAGIIEKLKARAIQEQRLKQRKAAL